MLFQNHVFFFWIPVSIAEAAAVTLNGAKIFFANGTVTFINGLILLNNEPKDPPDWLILDIWVLENFISVEILFSSAFHSLFFGIVVNNNSWGNFFLQTTWYSFPFDY